MSRKTIKCKWSNIVGFFKDWHQGSVDQVWRSAYQSSVEVIPEQYLCVEAGGPVSRDLQQRAQMSSQLHLSAALGGHGAGFIDRVYIEPGTYAFIHTLHEGNDHQLVLQAVSTVKPPI